MNSRSLMLWIGLAAITGTFAFGDSIKPKSGAVIEGVIKKVENGKVTIQVGNETRTVDLLQVDQMDFDTPHLEGNTDPQAINAFLKDKDAQALVRLSMALKLARQSAAAELDSIKKNWQAKQPIDRNQARRWEGAKESFQVPMKRYQEIIRAMYLDVLARVEDYNNFATEADKVYVGVKGILNVGSPLLSTELDEIAAKKVVPRTWYDKIFYEGYSKGYKEGSALERINVLPPARGASSNDQ